MLSFDEGEGDLYFDSVDSLSVEEPVVSETKEELECGHLDYAFWLSEPRSVKERRQNFFREMNLDEFAFWRDEHVGLERIAESSGAVSSSSVSSTNREEQDSFCFGREELNSGANVLFDNDLLDDPNVDVQNIDFGPLPCEQFEAENGREFEVGKKKMKSWWKHFVKMNQKRRETCKSQVLMPSYPASKPNRTKVKQNKKRCMQFTGLFVEQEIQGHKGFIWTMKFSPDGQYLATGGADGMVRIWRIASVNASCKSFTSERSLDGNWGGHKSGVTAKRMIQASVMIPGKIFQIEEVPLHEFQGHKSDVLDLAWSGSNLLLSSSMDKTVHLWQVGCSNCLNVFHHSDYVTCVQFNPINENYFITGSIDGKVRIWGLSGQRVVDWADVRDVISTLCYKPDGMGFVVGSVTGSCRFYQVSGDNLQLEAEIRIHGRKRSTNRITSIQFVQGRSLRVMIASEDSKLRIFDGFDIVKKYKGLPKSGSQRSASFTSSGRQIISVGEDSHVYVWDYDEFCHPSAKHIKSLRSCEHFFSEGVCLAVPWSGLGAEMQSSSSQSLWSHREMEPASSLRSSSQPFSLGNCFLPDGRRRFNSATWPEEELPHWDVAAPDEVHQNQLTELGHELINLKGDHVTPSDAWGLVIVTASRDGTIRTFHNYGLPIGL